MEGEARGQSFRRRNERVRFEAPDLGHEPGTLAPLRGPVVYRRLEPSPSEPGHWGLLVGRSIPKESALFRVRPDSRRPWRAPGHLQPTTSPAPATPRSECE